MPGKSTSPKPKRKIDGAALPRPTASEAAFERAFAALVATAPAVPVHDERDAFVERVFAKSKSYIDDPYSTIGDAAFFHTKVKGVSFEGRQDVLAGLQNGRELTLERQPDNPHDANAIAVWYGNLQIGFISKEIATHVAPRIDAGARYRARIASLTGGGEKNRGVNIFVERDEEAAPRRAASARDVAAAPAELAERVREALIGMAEPHDAQRAVLDRLDRGLNTLAIFGTGRGKSFCFQFTAAMRALIGGGKTLIVYPLRALANDQYEALIRRLDPLGLRIHRANGSISGAERAELFEALRDGAWDLILATPEFLEFHRTAFTGSSAPSLVVVDEAHHLYDATHRPAYAHLGATIASLGKPQVLALTATAGGDAFARIVDALRIQAWTIDPTVRENLSLVDARETKEKKGYLRELFANGEKGIVYCNSRSEATSVANDLRKALGNTVMFYHAGMPTAERQETEMLFRSGGLRVVVATSAFGEGIDLPDVRHVVLYHLNFDFTEFNQQAGRAGRDGAPAQIHLLFGERDRQINDFLIDLDAPTLPVLRSIYKGLRALAHEGVLHGSNAELSATVDLDKVRDRTIGAALRIFEDSSLIEIGEDDQGRFVRFLPVDAKVDMERNERFAEGEATRESFKEFCELALRSSASALELLVNRPIYPSRVELRH